MVRANSRSDHDTPVTERILQDKTKKAADNQDTQFLDSVLESSLPFTRHPGSIICSHFVLGYKKELYAVTGDTGSTPPECESGVKMIEEFVLQKSPSRTNKNFVRIAHRSLYSCTRAVLKELLIIHVLLYTPCVSRRVKNGRTDRQPTT